MAEWPVFYRPGDVRFGVRVLGFDHTRSFPHLLEILLRNGFTHEVRVAHVRVQPEAVVGLARPRNDYRILGIQSDFPPGMSVVIKLDQPASDAVILGSIAWVCCID